MSPKSNEAPSADHLDGCDPKEIALKSFFLGPQAENIDDLMSLISEALSEWADWRRSYHPEDGLAISQKNRQSKFFIERQKKFADVTRELTKRFSAELPKFSPRYVGHMVSETSLPALVGHWVTLLHNPNNISGEASRVGIQLEDEAVRFVRRMMGYAETPASGHFTSGGTVANFESLLRSRTRSAQWLAAHLALLDCSHRTGEHISFHSSSHGGWKTFDRNVDELIGRMGDRTEAFRKLKKWDWVQVGAQDFAERVRERFKVDLPSPVFLVPENKHYSWKKAATLLGFGASAIWPIELCRGGRLSTRDLELKLKKAKKEDQTVLQVVSVLGSTELGSIDPIHEVQDVLDELRQRDEIHIWHHVDAAYGGFYRSLDLEKTSVLSPRSLSALKAVSRAESITLDPHKLGYVPYSSGTILVRDSRDYRCHAPEDTPYIQFDERMDRGPYTLEGSRSAAGAVAMWMMSKTLGLGPEGYGLLLERTTRITRELECSLRESLHELRLAPGCDTNIVCFTVACEKERLSESNLRTLEIYKKFSYFEGGSPSYIVSKTVLNREVHGKYLGSWITEWDPVEDVGEVVLIRMCIMNPFFGSHESRTQYPDDFIRCLKEVISELNLKARK